MKITISLSVKPDDAVKIRKLAEIQDISVSQYIRFIIKDHWDREGIV